MKTRNLTTLIAAIAVLGLLTFNFFNTSHAKAMPDIAFTDIDGQQHQLSDFKGNPILVIFWATDCPSCVAEMPKLVELHDKYAEKGLTLLGIALAHDTAERIKTMRKHKSLPYLLTWDEKGELAKAFEQVRVTPTHFLINPKGQIVMRKIGDLNINLVENHIAKMGLTK